MSSNNFLPTSIILISNVLSLYKTFDLSNNEIDYFPTTLDINIYRKILWYFSQFTFSNSIFLLLYFMFKILQFNTDKLFIIISPISISINLNYFLILYPKKYIRLYELPFYSFVQHFMTTFIILDELQYIEYNNLYEIFYYNYFILYGILITYFNYYVRGFWTYGIANLYTYKGWKLFLQFNIISFISSLFLYSIKNNL